MRFDFWHNWKLEDGSLFFTLISMFVIGVTATVTYNLFIDLETCKVVAETVPEIKIKDLK